MEREYTPEQVNECSRDLCFQSDHCTTDCYKYNCEKTWLATNLLRAGWVKQPEGEWVTSNIGGGKTTRTCSHCHVTQTVTVFEDKVMFEYCPYCGAKMKRGSI